MYIAYPYIEEDSQLYTYNVRIMYNVMHIHCIYIVHVHSKATVYTCMYMYVYTMYIDDVVPDLVSRSASSKAAEESLFKFKLDDLCIYNTLHYLHTYCIYMCYTHT